MIAIPVFAASVLFAVLVASAAGDSAALRAAGTRAYRAGKYAEACRNFERAAQLEPVDGAIQADLGLCLAKLGRTEDAIRANMEAVRLGDATTRKNAYFNLAALDPPLPVPAVAGCRLVASNVPGCRAEAGSCVHDWDSLEVAGIRESGKLLRVWMPAEAAPPGARSIPGAGDVALGWVERPDATGGRAPRDQYVLVTGRSNVAGTTDVLLSAEFLVASGRPSGSGDSGSSGADSYLDQLPGPVRCDVVAVDLCRGRIGIRCEERRAGTRPRPWGDEVELRASDRPPR